MEHLKQLAACAAVICLMGGLTAFADSEFRIENPELDYEVIDAYPFDGYGDFGPFQSASSVLLGTTGEAREVIEFDISPFVVPSGEQITQALFQVYIADNYIAGMGVPWGDTPDLIALQGYVGNGVADLSDFEAGNDNILGRMDLIDPYIGQQLTWDITDYVRELVDAGETWLGLTVKAEEFGGIMLFEGPSSPMLTINTTVPEPATLSVLALAGLALLRRR